MHFRKLFPLFPISLLVISLSLIVVSARKPQNLTQKAASNVSTLIFGTNLMLSNASDQFVTSSQTRTQLSNIHVQLIRVPVRTMGAGPPEFVTALQDIKQMGVIPLVIFKFTQTDPTGAAKQVIQQVNAIFGNSLVYYEFGNERDLAGVDQVAYTNQWNQTISQVKSLAPNGKFGGPANFQTNPGYIAYFVENANPQPDFISWHEYTCGNGQDPQTVCIGHIANWANHISNTKAAIAANPTHKTVPPIFITEWNYDPNNPAGDPRATPQFQQQFTQTALQELAKDGVAGATHYVATGHTEYNLVDPGGNLTPEGQMFGQMYTQLIGSGGGNPTPTLNNVTGTPNPTISGAPSPTLPLGVTPTGTLAPTAGPGTPAVTPIPTDTPTLTPTPTINLTPTPTPLPVTLTPGTAYVKIAFNSIDTQDALNKRTTHPRMVTLYFYKDESFLNDPDGVKAVKGGITDTVFFTPPQAGFTPNNPNSPALYGVYTNPQFKLPSFPKGNYYVFARSEGSLREPLGTVPVKLPADPNAGVYLDFTQNGTYQLPMGKVSSTNKTSLTIEDYNALLTCYNYPNDSKNINACKSLNLFDKYFISSPFVDFNLDNKVDGIDFNIFLGNFLNIGTGY